MIFSLQLFEDIFGSFLLSLWNCRKGNIENGLRISIFCSILNAFFVVPPFPIQHRKKGSMNRFSSLCSMSFLFLPRCWRFWWWELFIHFIDSKLCCCIGSESLVPNQLLFVRNFENLDLLYAQFSWLCSLLICSTFRLRQTCGIWHSPVRSSIVLRLCSDRLYCLFFVWDRDPGKPSNSYVFWFRSRRFEILVSLSDSTLFFFSLLWFLSLPPYVVGFSSPVFLLLLCWYVFLFSLPHAWIPTFYIHVL